MNWGMLMGVGKGLTGYSEIMGENKKRKWEEQKADLDYKRKVSLESLRANNQSQQAQTERGWRQEDQDKQNTFSLEKQKEQNQYQLETKEQDRKQDRLDYQWKLGQAKSIGLEESKEKMAQKKATWDEMVASGALDQYSEDQVKAMRASYIFDITLPKGSEPKRPTDEMFKIANELVIASAPEGTDPRELASSIQATAWGLAQDPNKVYSKLSGESDSEGSVTFNPQQVTELASLAKRAQSGNRGAAEKYDLQTANLKKTLGEGKYNELMTKVNSQAGNPNASENPTKKPEGRGMFQTAKNFGQREKLKREFEAAVNTKNMTPMMYDLKYDQWLKEQGI